MNKIMAQEAVSKIENLPDEAHINIDTVLLLVGVGRSKWYKGVKDGIYPRQVRDNGSARWVLGEIRQHKRALEAKRDSNKG